MARDKRHDRSIADTLRAAAFTVAIAVPLVAGELAIAIARKIIETEIRKISKAKAARE